MHGQLKRTHSPDCSDTDCSDDGTDVCAVTGSCDGGMGGGPTSTRKRRRGAIEKRRRDRINHSLDELKRLVPSALDKAGTAKLEKAEILQMTVEHLKTLHSRGLTNGGNSYDQHRIAFDYHSLGFRECATEVARYLFSVEGLDLQDPMRNRLLAHLQMFAAQKELSTRSAAAAIAPPPHQQHPGMTMSSVDTSSSWPSYTSCAYTGPALHADVAADALAGYFAPASTATRSQSTTSTTSSTANSQMHHSQYGHAASAMGTGSLAQNGFAFGSTATANDNFATSYVQSKVHRPWGAESLSC